MTKRHRLIQQRKRLGFTQERLAELVNVDPRTIRSWENGEVQNGPQAWMWPKLARHLQVTIEQLGEFFIDEPAEMPQFTDDQRRHALALLGDLRRHLSGTGEGEPVPTRVVQLYRGSNHEATGDHCSVTPLANDQTVGTLEATADVTPSAAWLLLAQLLPATADQGLEPTAQGSGSNEPLTALIRRWVDSMNRRELLGLLGWVVASANSPLLSDLNPDDQERLAKVAGAVHRVDAQVIEQLQTIYWSCRRQDDALGSQAVLPTVLAQLSLAQNMVQACPSQLQPGLLSTCSGLSGLAGWLFADLSDYRSSWIYFDQARALAHEARNPAMSSYTLGRMSHTAQMQHQGHRAIDYGEASRKAAEKCDDPLVRAHAASQTARAYAKDGDVSLCLEALEQTETHFAAANPQDAAASLAYFYDSGSLSNAKAICHLDLGKPREAAEQARSALRQHDGSVRDNAYTMLYLANAHIQLHEVDEATAIMGKVVDATSQSPSVRLLERLHDTRRALEPWRGVEAIQALDERLGDGRR